MTRVAIAVAAAVTAACGGDDAGTRRPDATPDRGATVRAAQRCDAADVSVVVDSLGIGPVLLGQRLGEVADRCPVADTALTLGEGVPERAHIVAISGRPVVALTTGTRDTSIIRVITVDPKFRTPGGVGVGSSVESLRLAHGRLCAARGETDFVVMAAALPGVSFAIDWSPPPSREPSAAQTPFPGGDPGTALDASRITKLWVHGVSGGCRVSVG